MNALFRKTLCIILSAMLLLSASGVSVLAQELDFAVSTGQGNGNGIDFDSLEEGYAPPTTTDPEDPLPDVGGDSTVATWEYVISAKGAELTGCTGAGGDILIPKTITAEGIIYPVWKLGDELFANNDALNSVTLSESVVEIGARTFYDADNLVCIVTRESLTTIGAEAFYSCDRFNSVVLYDTVTSIGAQTFAECPRATIWCNEDTAGYTYAVENDVSYRILNPNAEPETYTYGGITYYILNGEAAAVEYLSTLSHVVIPATVKDYPVTSVKDIFKKNTKLVAIDIQAKITSLGVQMFAVCTNLKTVVLPDSVTTIGASAFSGCYALNSITLPASMTSLGAYAFRNCSSLVSLDLPQGIPSIKEYTFEGCTKLKNISLPEGCSSIGDYAFSACPALESIYIPDSMRSFGLHAFWQCSQLKSIHIPDGVTFLGFNCFAYCISLKSVVIPNSVTTLESSAFRNCTGLETITIPGNMSTRGSEFYNCSSLKTVIISEGSTSVKHYSGFGCSLEEAEYDYRENTSITEVILPSTLTTIQAGAFFACAGITNINIPESVTTIGAYAFQNCRGITELLLPEGLTTIGAHAFSKNPNLKNVVIPQSVTSLQTTSFHNTTILFVYENSYAHTFAEANDVLYFVLRKAENPEIHFGAGFAGTVKYSDGTPAAEATVEILYNDGTLKESVLTEEDGSYTFTYAEVGAYTVRATDASGNTASTQVYIRRMNAFDVFRSGDTALTLKKGYTVSGTVNAGNATVTLTDPEGNVVSSTVADETGAFVIANIPNGTYILTAESETGTASQEITVFDGHLEGISLEIAASTATIWGYTSVENRDGSRAFRNWVQVTAYNDQGIAVLQCRSDADGKYTLSKLPVGTYSLVAETSEMRPEKNGKFDRSYQLTGYAYMVIDAAAQYRADIVLYEENDCLATISGKVTAHGQKQSSTVVLRDVFHHEVASYTTKSNGKYTFYKVRDGLYFITATTESDGMGYAVVVVLNGKVHGDTDITVYKNDKIQRAEAQFNLDVPRLESRDEALAYRSRIAQEKKFYDSLSQKEKNQLSADYVQRLNQYIEWIADTTYISDDSVIVQQGGLVVSGEELEQDSQVDFAITVQKVDSYASSTDGIHTREDFLYHTMDDAADKQELKQYYEITMTKTVDGEQKQITSVYKDTDTTGKFRVVLEIPQEYRGHKHYSILHEHCGEVVKLTDLDNNPNTITIEVDAFSTFVLTATDEILVPVTGAELWQENSLYGNYPSVEEALQDYNSQRQYIRLVEDTVLDLTLTQDLYIDLNGNHLSGVLRTNGYRVYGIDSATDDYTDENAGRFTCVDEQGKAVVPETVTELTAQYMAIDSDTGYTFHRFYFDITKINVVPSITGFGYKAEFFGDEAVQSQIVSMGYQLWITESNIVSRNTEFNKVLTLRLKNIDVINYGQTPINASVVMTLADGTVIESATVSYSMQQMVELVNIHYATLTEEQLTAVQAMLEAHPTMQTWSVENIFKAS